MAVSQVRWSNLSTDNQYLFTTTGLGAGGGKPSSAQVANITNCVLYGKRKSSWHIAAKTYCISQFRCLHPGCLRGRFFRERFRSPRYTLHWSCRLPNLCVWFMVCSIKHISLVATNAVPSGSMIAQDKRSRPSYSVRFSVLALVSYGQQLASSSMPMPTSLRKVSILWCNGSWLHLAPPCEQASILTGMRH